MKMPGSVSKLLTNRYVLYLVALLALFNVIGYMMMDKTQIVILFILIGYLMTCFSKNMVIVLLVPLVLVNLLTSGMMMKEGFEKATTTSGPSIVSFSSPSPAAIVIRDASTSSCSRATG
jgi:hypothetical protein